MKSIMNRKDTAISINGLLNFMRLQDKVGVKMMRIIVKEIDSIDRLQHFFDCLDDNYPMALIIELLFDFEYTFKGELFWRDYVEELKIKGI